MRTGGQGGQPVDRLVDSRFCWNSKANWGFCPLCPPFLYTSQLDKRVIENMDRKKVYVSKKSLRLFKSKNGGQGGQNPGFSLRFQRKSLSTRLSTAVHRREIFSSKNAFFSNLFESLQRFVKCPPQGGQKWTAVDKTIQRLWFSVQKLRLFLLGDVDNAVENNTSY